MHRDDECAVVVAAAIALHAAFSEEFDQATLQRERKLAQPGNADCLRKNLAGARLIERKDRRRRFEPAVAAAREARRIPTLIRKWPLLREPSDIERAQIRVEMSRMHVQKTRARSAAQIFVAAAHRKIGVDQGDIDGK